MKEKLDIRFTVLVAIILLAAFSRIIPHMPNFSPLGAIGLFGAAHFKKKWQVFLIPLAATWLSDLFINNVIYAQYYPEFTWLYSGFYWQYGSYLLIALSGLFLLKTVSPLRIGGAALTSTAIFFTITNFACWPGNPTYTQNFGGLLTCYAAGIPFLKGTLLGDVCYSVVLFGTFALAKKRFPVLQASKI
ncbi:MAG: hypothetical protein EPO24_12800 [Bacteroidetes bacterium]|nr:MAG: hypothetical protein EPO24_12800 [Bacteroidota bacterium]